MTDINIAGSFSPTATQTYPGDVVVVNEAVFIDSPTSTDGMLARMRLEIGDQGKSFNSTAYGDGFLTRFDLPVGLIDANSLSVVLLHQDQTSTPTSQYTLDVVDGVMTLNAPPLATDTLVVSGTSYSLFTNTELQTFLDESMLQHNHNRTIAQRVLGPNGFINYSYAAVNYDNMPEVERYPVVLLAVIEALWTLATDASTDIPVVTADGTNVPRDVRYNQLMRQIDSLQQRYDFFRNQLNVGLGRVEMFNLRRRSYLTNRLVPIYAEREYDDNNTIPKRILPPIDTEYLDENAGMYPDYGYWGGNW